MKKITLLSIALLIGTAATADSTIIKKCTGCHGGDFGKKALGKSEVVKNFSEKELSKSLHGYKDGSYGSQFKGLMRGQVALLSDKEIDQLAKDVYKITHPDETEK